MSSRTIFRPIVIARRNERRTSSVPARLIPPPVRATFLLSLLLLATGTFVAASARIPVYASASVTAVDVSRRLVRLDLTHGRTGAAVIITGPGATRPAVGVVIAVREGVAFARVAEGLPRWPRYEAHVEIGSTSLLHALIASDR